MKRNKLYDGIEIVTDSKKGGPDGDGVYTVQWYEWTVGRGRDCGLNRESTGLSRTHAEELAAWMKKRNARS